MCLENWDLLKQINFLKQDNSLINEAQLLLYEPWHVISNNVAIRHV